MGLVIRVVDIKNLFVKSRHPGSWFRRGISLILMSLGLGGCTSSSSYPSTLSAINKGSSLNGAPLSRHDNRWNDQLADW